MTKARWRHIFFILSLIMGIFWSAPVRAQTFLDEAVGRAKEFVKDPNMETFINATPGKMVYDGARDI